MQVFRTGRMAAFLNALDKINIIIAQHCFLTSKFVCYCTPGKKPTVFKTAFKLWHSCFLLCFFYSPAPFFLTYLIVVLFFTTVWPEASSVRGTYIFIYLINKYYPERIMQKSGMHIHVQMHAGTHMQSFFSPSNTCLMYKLPCTAAVQL